LGSAVHGPVLARPHDVWPCIERRDDATKVEVAGRAIHGAKVATGRADSRSGSRTNVVGESSVE
jgi:hypothetical protein